MFPKIYNLDQINKLFVKTTQELDKISQNAIEKAEKDLDQLYAIQDLERNFENTILYFDKIVNSFYFSMSLLHAIEYVSPDELLRNAAHHNILKLESFYIDNFDQNQKIYKLFKYYLENKAISENLSPERWYFLGEQIEQFKRSGLHLEPEKQERLKNIQKELSEHTLAFERNISADNKYIEVEESDLAGVSDHFKFSLKKNSQDKYILSIDYPTYFQIMENCKVESTRKALWQKFVTRAYPANSEELAQIIALRNEYALLVGYKSYAELDMAGQMIKDPDQAEKFLNNLLDKASKKADIEFKEIIKDLPENISLTQDNKFKPWDIAYIKNYYKKKNFDIDENIISEYFPLEHTLDGLLSIYQEFMGLEFKKQVIQGLWDPEIRTIEVYKNKKLIGYLLLDLFPRPGKFTHACYLNIIPTVITQAGEFYPALGLVIANFTAPTCNEPALLQRKDVITFFHEFGHALHGLLGSTELASFSGTRVKVDFVEMPSQMLEEWMWEPFILKRISKHFKTGESLSDNLIEKIVESKHFDTGFWVTRQIFYSLLSLNYFKSGAYKDLDKVFKDTFDKVINNIEFIEKDHTYASFGHLTGYGSRYYSYLWSKVFALDLFYYIKQFGILNTDIGKRYIDKILSKGGSKDPNKLLIDFLEREPKIDAFLQDLELNT